jgi:hypothetical protein
MIINDKNPYSAGGIGEILAHPIALSAGYLGELFTWLVGGLVLLVVIPLVFRKLTRERDLTALLMLTGGVIALLLEAMIDHLGHLWYPRDLPGPAYIGFDVHVPLLSAFCYLGFIGLTGYWACEIMKKPMTVKKIFVVWLLLCISDLFLEIPMTAFDVYVYYGDVPLKILGFPLAFAWMNGTCMLLIGLILLVTEPHLKGWKRSAILLIPVSGMAAAYGIVGWPYFIALNWPLPTYAVWLWTLTSLAISLLTIRFIAGAVLLRQLYIATEPTSAQASFKQVAV